MTTTLLCLALISANADATETTTDERKWALQLRLTSPTATLSSFGGLSGLGGVGAGGLGLVTSSGTGVGLLLERAVADHWTVQLGLDGSVNRSSSTLMQESAGIALAPGARWYATRALAGGWIGAQVPVAFGWSSVSGNGFNSWSRSLVASLELLFGWAFRWENRLLVSLGAGPTASLSRYWVSSAVETVNGNSIPISGESFGVRAFVAVGLVL